MTSNLSPLFLPALVLRIKAVTHQSCIEGLLNQLDSSIWASYFDYLAKYDSCYKCSCVWHVLENVWGNEY